jgi:hypothetical protein
MKGTNKTGNQQINAEKRTMRNLYLEIKLESDATDFFIQKI